MISIIFSLIISLSQADISSYQIEENQQDLEQSTSVNKQNSKNTPTEEKATSGNAEEIID